MHNNGTKIEEIRSLDPGPIRRNTKIDDNDDAPHLAAMFATYARKHGLMVYRQSYLGREFASCTDSAKTLDEIIDSALSPETKNRMGGFKNARKMLIPIILQYLEQN